jgi:hypothetical protein
MYPGKHNPRRGLFNPQLSGKLFVVNLDLNTLTTGWEMIRNRVLARMSAARQLTGRFDFDDPGQNREGWGQTR